MHIEAPRTLYVYIKSKFHILVKEEGASRCMLMPEDAPHMPTQSY